MTSSQNDFINYGKRFGLLLYFIVFVLWKILQGSVNVALLAINPRPHIRPFIVAVPLETQTDIETAILASVVTLTPGTLSVDIGYEANEPNEPNEDAQERRSVLFVHSLSKDPIRCKKNVKKLEDSILKITGTKPL